MTLNKFAAVLALSMSLTGIAMAQSTDDMRKDAAAQANSDKHADKSQAKADKKQAKADKAAEKELNSDKAKKAAHKQDKADAAADKAAAQQ